MEENLNKIEHPSTQKAQLPEVGFSSLLIRWMAAGGTGAPALQSAETAAITCPTFLSSKDQTFPYRYF